MKRNLSFDGLRAVAVTMVWLSHLDAPHFYNGVIGVDIFFVLSGYLITGVLVQEHAEKGDIDLTGFYVRRFLRLTPALWLLLGAALIWYAAEPRIRPGTLGAVLASAGYFMNYNRIYHWMGEVFLGHSWSLAIEEQFYLLWPFLLILVPQRFWLRATVGLILAATAWRLYAAFTGLRSFAWIYNSFECRVDLLLIGCAASLIGPGPKQRMAAHLVLGWPVAVLVIAAVFLGPPVDEPTIMAVTVTCVALATGVLILAIEAQGSRGLLAWAPMVRMGQISYGIYLWHYPLLAFSNFYGLGGAWNLLNIPLTLAVCLLSFRYVEQPVLRLKARLARVDARLTSPA